VKQNIFYFFYNDEQQTVIILETTLKKTLDEPATTVYYDKVYGLTCGSKQFDNNIMIISRVDNDLTPAWSSVENPENLLSVM